MRDALLTARTRRYIIGTVLTGRAVRTADAVATVAAQVAAGSLTSITGATFGLFDSAVADDSCSITSGLAVLTSPNNPWAATDVGKAIDVQGAGVAGATLRTTIAGYTSAGSITLSANASTTVAATSSSAGGLAMWGNLLNLSRNLPVRTNEAGTSESSATSSGTAPVSVKDYGAVGDGVTDDTLALQAAFDRNAGVVIPNGTFLYSTLTINTGNRISGPGTLKRKTTAGILTGESWTITASGVTDWSLEGITIDGNRAGQTGAAGFKLSGMLIRGASDWRIDGVKFVNHHQDCIEITSATQNNPTGPDTPGAQPTDVIRRGLITGCLFKDSGQNYDAGSGYSDAMAVQIGSSTEDVSVIGCRVYNCMAGFLAAAYNLRLRISDNTLYVDSTTYTFRSSGIAVEQMSDSCAVVGNSVENFREGINAESVLRTTIAGNAIKNCIRGINCFASSIGGVLINMREVSIVGNTVKGSTNQAISARKSSGNGAFAITVADNVCNGGTVGVELAGLTGFAASGNFCTGCGSGMIVGASCVDGVVSDNECLSNTTEGIYVDTNTRVAILGNTCSGNKVGIDVAAAQTDLTVMGNVLSNNAAGAPNLDLRINTPNTNSVRQGGNRHVTSSNVVKTLAASGDSLQYVSDVTFLSAATYQGLITHEAGRIYGFVALGAVTLKHNTGASGSKFFNRAGADVVLAANQAIAYGSDGTHLYQLGA